MNNGGQIHAQQSPSTFRRECSVAVEIRAPAERVWALLTDAEDMARWNSTLTTIEGPIELGSTVRMRVPEAPDRTFKPKVTRSSRIARWSGARAIRSCSWAFERTR